MAQSESNRTSKIWRTALIGAAAVPIAAFAASPAFAAGDVEEPKAAQVEQVPELPGDTGLPAAPDPAVLLELQTCLTDLQAALGEAPEVPAPEVPAPGEEPPAPVPPAGAEQAVPPVPGDTALPTELPDVTAMNDTCQAILKIVVGDDGGEEPPADGEVPPEEPPADGEQPPVEPPADGEAPVEPPVEAP